MMQLKEFQDLTQNEIHKRNHYEIMNEEPIQFLIFTENGLPVFSTKFGERPKIDSSLAACFLTACMTFGKELFERYPEHIKMGEYNLAFKKIGKVFMV